MSGYVTEVTEDEVAMLDWADQTADAEYAEQDLEDTDE